MMPRVMAFVVSLALHAAYAVGQPAEQVAQAAEGATRIAVLNFGVGDRGADFHACISIELDAKMLADVAPLLKKDRVQVVVLHVDASGGVAAEAEAIQKVLAREYATKFRVAAWIREARSCATMAMWGIPEIYMEPAATLGMGKIMGLDTVLQADSTVESDWKWLAPVSVAGGHDLKILDALLRWEPLSIDVDATTGARVLRADAQGSSVINRPGRSLALDAAASVAVGLAKGIASDRSELATAMGIKDPVWAGEEATSALDTAISNNRVQYDMAFDDLARFVLATQTLAEQSDPRVLDTKRNAALVHLKKLREDIGSKSMMLARLGFPGGQSVGSWFNEQREKLLEIKVSTPIPWPEPKEPRPIRRMDPPPRERW